MELIQELEDICYQMELTCGTMVQQIILHIYHIVKDSLKCGSMIFRRKLGL